MCRQHHEGSVSRKSLLQRLLAKEIRQEHCMLLQCFRFLVNNNFLQDPDTDKLVFSHETGPAEDPKTGASDLSERHNCNGTSKNPQAIRETCHGHNIEAA